MAYVQNVLYYRCASTNFEELHSVTVPATAKPADIARNYAGNKNYRLVKLTDIGNKLIYEFNRGMKSYSISVMDSHRGQYSMQWKFLASDVFAKSSREALRMGAPITTKLENQRPLLTRPRPGVTVFEFNDVKYAVEIN